MDTKNLKSIYAKYKSIDAKMKAEAEKIIRQCGCKIGHNYITLGFACENQVNIDEKLVISVNMGSNYLDVTTYNDDNSDYAEYSMSEVTGEELYEIALAVIESVENNYFKVKVDWDTDGEDPKDLDLQTEVYVPKVDVDGDEIDISDWLSDEYGFCVNSWEECE